ncbi:protealysin inhibitor emfourin [Bradyrhizobium sp. BRP22]|uniref:protealysin inhibitor emfourin n=1 Tax=Bradyrhizobium sp. BRP22 TaxID=2793821 RepID=UPI0031FCE6B2
MKVTLVQRGGLAAGINLQRPPQVVDAATLDGTEAAELKALADAAIAAPAGNAPGKARDEMSHVITVEDQGRQTVLSQSDTTMSAEFGELLAWLRRHLKNR